MAVVMVIPALFNVSRASGDEVCKSHLGDAVCRTASGVVGPLSPGVVSGSQLITRTMECGPRRKAFDDTQFLGNAGCLNYLVWCPLAPGKRIDPTHEIIVYRVSNAATTAVVRTDIACDTPVGSKLPTIAAIRDEITKRAPMPRARAGGTDYVVNPAIVFYLTSATPGISDVRIPRFTLGGHQFSARLHLTKTSWQWGDGSGATFTGRHGDDLIGQPYRESRPCESVPVCAHYISHAYTSAGRFTVTVEAHWTGTFTLDGGTVNIPIPGDIFRLDTLGAHLTVRPAHSVLVPPSPP